MFSGSAHPELAAAVAAEMGVELSPTRVSRFSNDCLEVQLQANCRQRDVYVVQPLVPPVQEALVELLHKYYDTLAWANGDRHRLWSDERRLQVR